MVEIVLWALVALITLLALFGILRAERRRFERLGKGRGWLYVRLLALPILSVAAALVLLPSRLVPGMAALAYFYVALFTVAPLAWFGLHWLAGSLQAPPLSRGESASLAFSGLALLAVPALIAGVLQGPLQSVSRQVDASVRAGIETAPLALVAERAQRFSLGAAGEILTQTLRAPPGVRVERIERYAGGHWSDTATSMHDFLCRRGQDVHLAWPIGSPPDPLRIYWRDAAGKRYQATYRVDEPALLGGPARPFVVGWRDDGIDLPVPLMRDVVQLGWGGRPDGALYYNAPGVQRPDESFEQDCVARGYRRVAWREEGPIEGVVLRFRPAPPAPAWQAEFRRHAP